MNNRETSQTKGERREKKKRKKMKVSGSGVKELRRVIAKKDKSS